VLAYVVPLGIPRPIRVVANRDPVPHDSRGSHNSLSLDSGVLAETAACGTRRIQVAKLHATITTSSHGELIVSADSDDFRTAEV
jgi:hypothetical protein